VKAFAHSVYPPEAWTPDSFDGTRIVRAKGNVTMVIEQYRDIAVLMSMGARRKQVWPT
jgi:hypothetical protein